MELDALKKCIKVMHVQVEVMVGNDRTLGYIKEQQAWRSWSACLPFWKLQDAVHIPAEGREFYYIYVIECSKTRLKFN